jgi:hypothetical protein
MEMIDASLWLETLSGYSPEDYTVQFGLTAESTPREIIQIKEEIQAECHENGLILMDLWDHLFNIQQDLKKATPEEV